MAKVEDRTLTEELNSLAMRFVKVTESIGKRANQGGLSWFSPTAWEFTELDCREAAKLAGEIKTLLNGVNE